MYLCEASGAGVVMNVLIVESKGSFILELKHLPRAGDLLGFYSNGIAKVYDIVLAPSPENARILAGLEEEEYTHYELSNIDALVFIGPVVSSDHVCIS